MRFLMILMVTAVFYTGCSTKPETVTAENFPVLQPIVADTSFIQEYVAKIESPQYVQIHAKIEGYLEEILVDEGSSVKKGQLLFRINSQQFQRELNATKAAVKSIAAEVKAAELELVNIKALATKNIISNTEVEIAEAKVDAIRAKVEEAKASESKAALNVSLTEIRASFDGVVNRIHYKIGSLIDEGTLLTTLSSTKEVFAYFHVSEVEYLSYKKQKQFSKEEEITLILANDEVHQYKGKIETIEGEFDETTGNIAFRAKFPNPDGLLKHGSSGKVQLVSKLSKALLIPQEATFEVQEYMYVFVVDSANVVRMRKIKPQRRLGLSFVVESGLSSSDVIVAEGIQLLKEGDVITPEKMPLLSKTR